MKRLKMVKITKFWDKIALFWTFKLLRKKGHSQENRDSRKFSIKIGTVPPK